MTTPISMGLPSLSLIFCLLLSRVIIFSEIALPEAESVCSFLSALFAGFACSSATPAAVKDTVVALRFVGLTAVTKGFTKKKPGPCNVP